VTRVRPPTVAALRGLQKTAWKYYGVRLSDDQARRVARDPDLAPELGPRDGYLDTLGRDYLIMAIIELVMPGPPAVQDATFSREQKYWHWPMNASNPAYAKAFYTAFKAACRAKGFKLHRNFPG
jgi:hypothetical protein